MFLMYKNGAVLVYTHDVKSIGEGILDVRYDKKTKRFCIRQETVTGIANYGYENTNTVYHDDYYYFSLGAEGFKQVGSAKDTTWITCLSPRSWSGVYEIDGAQVSSLKEFDEYIRQGDIIIRLSNVPQYTLDEVIRAYKKKIAQESSKSDSTR